MNKQAKIYKSLLGVAIVTVLILLIPFVAMQFTDEVKWGLVDFIVAGALLFTTGIAFVLMVRSQTNFIYRLAFGAAIGTTLLLIWANLAVGLIGAGPNPGNLMYIGVIAVVIIGTYLSRFTAKGMELAMLASATALVLVTVIALLIGMHQYLQSSVTEIIVVNAFFATLYAVSGLLFRHVAMNQSSNSVSEAS